MMRGQKWNELINRKIRIATPGGGLSMYCQACGNEQPAELSYCNRCGARFGSGRELQIRSSAKLTATVVALSASMTVITLVGFISVIASAMSLLERDLRMPDGFVFLL